MTSSTSDASDRRRPRLYYIYDPMCSWCWGFKPVWQVVCDRLRDRFEIIYVVGGLAPETDEPMPLDMRDYLQAAWQRVETVTGVVFNHDFWRNNVPRRSTYPACKAVLVAREWGKEVPMYERIQRFYYQEAGNPSEYANLYRLAEELGMERSAFIERIHSKAIENKLHEEIGLAEALGAQGFPSVVVECDGKRQFVQHSYTDVEENIRLITTLCR